MIKDFSDQHLSADKVKLLSFELAITFTDFYYVKNVARAQMPSLNAY